jgi:hypothetical protein
LRECECWSGPVPITEVDDETVSFRNKKGGLSRLPLSVASLAYPETEGNDTPFSQEDGRAGNYYTAAQDIVVEYRSKELSEHARLGTFEVGNHSEAA